MSSEQIHNQVRAFSMGPGSFTWLSGKKIKIHKTQVKATNGVHNQNMGQCISINSESISVQCGQGVLDIYEVQPESRNRMAILDLLKNSADEKVRFGK